MAAIYSNGGNRWNILGFNFTKRDALSSVYKISMAIACWEIQHLITSHVIILISRSPRCLVELEFLTKLILCLQSRDFSSE
jgi:hypothetical protein